MLEVLLLAATLGTQAAIVDESAADEFLEFLAEFDADEAEMFATDAAAAAPVDPDDALSKPRPAAAAAEESSP